MIPVKKDKYWSLYDKNGNQLTEFKYDSLGYVASNNKDALNLLVIPNYNVLVACKDKKYTLMNASGEELFAIVADDIYMEISGGEKHYYIIVNDQRIDAEEWMNLNGITAKSGETNQTKKSENSTNTNDNNDNNSENLNQNQNENNNEQEEQQEENNNDNNDENNNNNDNNYDDSDNYNNQEEQNQQEENGDY